MSVSKRRINLLGRGLWLAFMAWCDLAALAGAARADAGAIRASETVSGYRVSVFSSPTPLRVGLVDVSVLVQDAATGQPVPDAQVTVRARHRTEPSASVTCAATAAAATNKLFRAAVFELPEPGWWDVEVEIGGLREPVRLNFEMEAAERLPTWRSLWPWLAWPAGVVLLYGVHQFLVRRRRQVSAVNGF